jgi:hypothetical protein
VLKVRKAPQEVSKQVFSTKDRAGNDNLPSGALNGGRFRKIYIPTVIAYISAFSDAFKFSDEDLLHVYWASWDTVYGNTIPCAIEVGDAVFNIVSSF